MLASVFLCAVLVFHTSADVDALDRLGGHDSTFLRAMNPAGQVKNNTASQGFTDMVHKLGPSIISDDLLAPDQANKINEPGYRRREFRFVHHITRRPTQRLQTLSTSYHKRPTWPETTQQVTSGHKTSRPGQATTKSFYTTKTTGHIVTFSTTQTGNLISTLSRATTKSGHQTSNIYSAPNSSSKITSSAPHSSTKITSSAPNSSPKITSSAPNSSSKITSSAPNSSSKITSTTHRSSPNHQPPYTGPNGTTDTPSRPPSTNKHDTTQAPPPTTTPSLPDVFICHNLKPIPLTKICDGVNDCGDDSDETITGCLLYPTPTRVCAVTHFTCQNQKCLHKIDVCDGFNDCGDNSDEDNCDVKQRSTASDTPVYVYVVVPVVLLLTLIVGILGILIYRKRYAVNGKGIYSYNANYVTPPLYGEDDGCYDNPQYQNELRPL